MWFMQLIAFGRNSRSTNCDARINEKHKNQPGRKSIRIYCLIKFNALVVNILLIIHFYEDIV